MVPQILNEGGGEKVAILALDEAGRVSAFRMYTVRGNAFHSSYLGTWWRKALLNNLA